GTFVPYPCHDRAIGRKLDPTLRYSDRQEFEDAGIVFALVFNLVKYRKEEPVERLLRQLWSDECGQDIAEYAVMLAVILVIVVGTVRLIGSNANTVFSSVGSAIQ